jgi:hypothetical protein
VFFDHELDHFGRQELIEDSAAPLRSQTADILLATNNRFASFLSEAGRPVTPGAVFAPPSPEDIERLIRVSQAYGYWNAPPAESAAITG